MTKTEKLEAAIELLKTEAGIEELFNEMLVDPATGSLSRNQYAGLMERINKVWTKLDSARKADAAESIRRLMEMNGITATDLGFAPATGKTAKAQKKEGDSVKFVIWYRDSSGAVQTAHVGQKGGMNGEPKEFLVAHGGIKRTEVLVKGENNDFLSVGKHLTKEEFEAAYPAQ